MDSIIANNFLPGFPASCRIGRHVMTATGQAALREVLDVLVWFNILVRFEVLNKRYFR